MTVLVVGGLVLLFFLIPYLAGNAYGFVFRKKTLGIVSTYLSGVAIVYAFLAALQLVVVKFKFDFSETVKIYNVLFLIFIIFGCIGLIMRGYLDKAVKWDVLMSKRTVWILGIILLQGLLYIVLKNPYFENNALLETTKVTMETGTVYEYNAFTGNVALKGFPLSNKLIFLPMFYAYISELFGVNVAVLFNFVLPVVTFISFYLVMILWVQKLGEAHKIKWEMLLLMLIWIVQIGDGWSHSTAFRILHTGYMGEALFFGVLLPYALYLIKNRCYLIAVACAVTFPGLIKYDAVFDFIKGFNEYRKEGAMYGGMLLVYILAVVFYMFKYKKASLHLLILNLTIAVTLSEIWNYAVGREREKVRKILNGTVLLVLTVMCGNMILISDVTQWRNNMYGASETEYEMLKKLDDENEDGAIKIAACDEVIKWVKRLDFDIEPVVGYDLGGKEVQWYSYEEYDENHTRLWQNVNYAAVDMEQELMSLKDEIDMDYVIVERITDLIPIVNNTEIKCVYATPSYLVYSVDKK